MRCHNSKRECPGYRDLSRVRFGGKPASMNGNSSVSEDKNRARSQNRDASPSAHLLEGARGQRQYSMADNGLLCDSVNSSPEFQNGALTSHFGQNTLASMHLKLLDHEVAQCFFLANFIMLPSTAIRMGHLNFIIPLLKTAGPRSPLQSAFSAVSFAALGTQPNSRALVSKAKLGYVQALKHINVALADPKQAKGDPILASTLLMTVYEVCTLLHLDLLKVRTSDSHARQYYIPKRISKGGILTLTEPWH
jgi:Fungal specific transcription factor domain